MSRIAGLVLAVLMVAAATARSRADVGPPIREGLPDMRFENVEDYPKFDFYVKYAVGHGNPFASPHIRRVESGGKFLHFEERGRLGGAVLVAVPHGQPAPALTEHRWHDPPPAGCMQSDPLPGYDLGKNARVSYGVRIADDKLKVEMQSSEKPAGEESAGGAAGPSSPRSPWAVVGIVLGASCLGGLGVWLARRFVLPNRETPGEC